MAMDEKTLQGGRPLPLTLVGLGIWNHRDISLRGLEAVREADAVYLDGYTSRLAGSTTQGLTEGLGRDVTVLGREELEGGAERGLLTEARTRDVVLLVGGDPMVSTTHVDLRLKAAAMGVPTRVVHGASIQSAVCGLTGLQNYRFGRSATVTYPHRKTVSQAPVDVVRANFSIGAHTMLYLDLHEEHGPMTVPLAAQLLMQAARDGGWPEFAEAWAVGVARAGSPEPVVATRRVRGLGEVNWGGPLHVLVVPAPLHVVEAEALRAFGGAPDEIEDYVR